MNPIDFLQVVIAGGAATAIATQILKGDYVPADFQRYPRLTAAGVSLVSAAVALYVNNYSFVLSSLGDYLTVSALIFLIAATTYNFVLKQTGVTRL